LALAGTALTTLGMFWLAQISASSGYLGGLLGPMVVFATGLGLTFMPLTLAAVSQVDEGDTGIASGVLNTTQQIGGSIGLALLTTVATTVITSELKETGTAPPTPGQVGFTPDQAVAVVEGWTAAFQVSAALAALAFIITVFAIKVTKDEAAEATPMAAA